MARTLSKDGGMDLPSLKFLSNLSWRAHARCAKLSKSVFFDYNKKGLAKELKRNYINTAFNACAVCPVASECYEFAVKNNEPYGIWSGTFPEERKQLYKDFIENGVFIPKTPQTQ